ncbi:hypothetical protein OG778_23770 [Streptomyces sp. NBC_00184]|uniref:hypothetical protein n=1 Tax=Streptomyces sp. NBC_00184 TaxID=2975673 RepID=UPI002E299D9F|nr:hypothetical protein [Streptomyces sp. NBC_00184]
MINAVLVDLPEHNARVRRIKRVFNDACWALDVEPEFVDVTSYDSRAGQAETVPTLYVFDDADPYGAPLAEHRGAFNAEDVTGLIERGLALV